jgi:predicted GIY-YIG superfamily endonuclease
MEKPVFYYVYILQSVVDTKRFYTGYTAKYKPWRIKTAIAFTDRNKAFEFERYLKSPSGREFAKKRL